MFEKERALMVESQLKKRGIQNRYVLSAMSDVPRERFLPDKEGRTLAYSDIALPIGRGQTISQPYMLALMLELLELSPGDKVLEIGTGCGYAAAVMSRVASKVITVERDHQLVEFSRNNLKDLKFSNVRVVESDGSGGEVHYYPYEKIIFSCALPKIPLDLLLPQLSIRGIIVAPVGDRMKQKLVKIVREGSKLTETYHGDCSFVPAIGKNGF